MAALTLAAGFSLVVAVGYGDTWITSVKACTINKDTSDLEVQKYIIANHINVIKLLDSSSR